MFVELINQKDGNAMMFKNVTELKNYLKKLVDFAMGDEQQEIVDMILYSNEFIEDSEYIEGHFYTINVLELV